MTDQQKRLHLWHRLQHTIRIESILICPFCTDAYVLRYAQGASRAHCSSITCRVEHARDTDERNRQQCRARARATALLKRGIS